MAGMQSTVRVVIAHGVPTVIPSHLPFTVEVTCEAAEAAHAYHVAPPLFKRAEVAPEPKLPPVFPGGPFKPPRPVFGFAELIQKGADELEVEPGSVVTVLATPVDMHRLDELDALVSSPDIVAREITFEVQVVEEQR